MQKNHILEFVWLNSNQDVELTITIRLSGELSINVSDPRTWIFSVKTAHSALPWDKNSLPPRKHTEIHEFLASGLAEYVTLYCLEHGVWSTVAIHRIHEDDSTTSLFSSEKIGGLRTTALAQEEKLHLNEMLIKTYLAWI